MMETPPIDVYTGWEVELWEGELTEEIDGVEEKIDVEEASYTPSKIATPVGAYAAVIAVPQEDGSEKEYLVRSKLLIGELKPSDADPGPGPEPDPDPDPDPTP
jgi:hypothetical protein